MLIFYKVWMIKLNCIELDRFSVSLYISKALYSFSHKFSYHYLKGGWKIFLIILIYHICNFYFIFLWSSSDIFPWVGEGDLSNIFLVSIRTRIFLLLWEHCCTKNVTILSIFIMFCNILSRRFQRTGQISPI